MECVLCEMWAKMPYVKKPTTPTTVQETESALIIGYWLSRNKNDDHICEHHQTILTILNKETHIQPRQEQLLPTTVNPNPLYIPFTPPVVTAPAGKPFVIGPGPLTNENSVTQIAPPPCVEADPSAIYRQAASLAAKPGTAEGALEAAKMPPVEGGKVSYNCTLCGATVMTGDVHAC
jgi:hypothetical protein